MSESETDQDNFRFMDGGSGGAVKWPRQHCVFLLLVTGVVISLLLSVISLSVVVTQYRVEIHVAANSESPKANHVIQPATLEQMMKLENIQRAKLEQTAGDENNCSAPQGGRFATQYILTVRVGHIKNAQTDDPIYARLIGQYGACGRFKLATPINDFQLGATDEFLLTCDTAIGELQMVEMHNQGNDGLYIEVVTVLNLANQREYDLPCECWIDDSTVRTKNLTVERHCAKVEL